jgi:hypothetical protein
MLVPIERQAALEQFLPKDELDQVQSRCSLQSWSRLARTCRYINDNSLKVENILSEQFFLVEKCLYFYAPEVSLSLSYGLRDDKMVHIKNRLYNIIDAHREKIDASIREIHSHIKQTKWGSSFVDTLILTDVDRMVFYGGKLPGQKHCCVRNLYEYNSNSEDSLEDYEQSIDDHCKAAHEDARYAALKSNHDRTRAVLNLYGQFPECGNKLIAPLCALGNGPILVKYLSIAGRNIEKSEQKSGFTAIEIATMYENQELVEFLQKVIDLTKEQNN